MSKRPVGRSPQSLKFMNGFILSLVFINSLRSCGQATTTLGRNTEKERERNAVAA